MEGERKYKVCIQCKTYNQENYIRQAIESFLMQKTSFPYIAVILDDASTDNTPKIIREYEEKYPEIIKGIYLKENRWQKGISQRELWVEYGNMSEYITYCDGDDYWIDENKLQREVEILDKNPTISMVCASRYVLLPNGELYPDIFENKILKSEDILQGIYLHSQVMIHRSVPNYLESIFKKYHLDYKKMGGDDEMMLGYYYSLIGDVVTLPNIVSVYRINDKGVWSKYSEQEKKYYELIAYYKNHKRLNFQYRSIFAESFFNKSWKCVCQAIKHHDVNRFTLKILFIMIKYLSITELIQLFNHWLFHKS